jgi:hypothetical protein
MNGQCSGELLDAAPAYSHNECQLFCVASLPDCQFYSFNPSANLCITYKDCPHVEEELCPECVSGQPACILEDGVMTTESTVPTVSTPEPIADDLLFVALGFDYDSLGSIDAAELVDLEEPNTIPECMQPKSYPYKVTGASGAVIAGVPAVCGGIAKIGDFTNEFTRTCFQYNSSSRTWTESGNMTSVRTDAAADYSESWGFVVGGGFEKSSSALSSVERSFDGVTFEMLPPMPEKKALHCLNIINSDTIIVSAGWHEHDYHTNSAYVYDRSTELWSSISSLHKARFSLSCGVVSNNMGEKELVAVGGALEYQVVEIYSIASDTWRMANPMPIEIYQSTSVQHGSSFIMVGGTSWSVPSPYELKTIYKYSQDNDSWTVLEAELQEDKRDVVAMMVPKNMFPTCK